jgi:hypothetical protein
MPKSKSDILDDFQAFIGKHGGNYKEWYVGTSANPKVDLTKYHRIKNGDKGLMRTAQSELQAAEVAEFFIDNGAKGDPTVTRDNICVYAFKMDKHTKPKAA